MTKVVKRPGSRHGHFWIDKQGTVRYGDPPRLDPPAPRASSVAPTPHEPLSRENLVVPHHREFGDYSPEATLLNLRGALFYADPIAEICRRYRHYLGSLPATQAARKACRGLKSDEHLRLVRGLYRIRRLSDWADYGAKAAGDPEGSALPAPVATLTPFVQGALSEGLPLDAAKMLAGICGRASEPLDPGENEGHAHLASQLLTRPGDTDPPDEFAAPLVKAVLRPGSRGGHVYWSHGKLRYGTPPLWHPRSRDKGSTDIRPTWLAPGRMARRILSIGHRVLFLSTDQRKKWGVVIAASGEMLSVLPDDAQVYDLLHTVVVPAERVLRVIPDEEGMKDDEPEAADPTALREGARLAKSAPLDPGGAGPGGAAPYCHPLPEWEAEEAALEAEAADPALVR